MKPRAASRERSNTVLIAEDDEIIAQLVTEALEEAGFHAQSVADGIEALNQILETKPDVIVLDLNLPRLQGYEICGMVRKSAAVQHTPIVVLSGLAGWDNKLPAFELGADDYVTKPFNVQELVTRVDSVLHRSRLRLYPTPFLAPPRAA
jgi:DNA-binding response OmpR family regulator